MKKACGEKHRISSKQRRKKAAEAKYNQRISGIVSVMAKIIAIMA